VLETHYLKFRSGQFWFYSNRRSVAISNSKTENQKTKEKENRKKGKGEASANWAVPGAQSSPRQPSNLRTLSLLSFSFSFSYLSLTNGTPLSSPSCNRPLLSPLLARRRP
jgi:hypothetical protein